MNLSEKPKIVIDLQYLPCLQYFLVFLSASEIYFDLYEHYEKQTYRNRCKIMTANGVQDLSVPILKGNSKQIMKDVVIDNAQKWQKNHWRGIYSAYGKAPFFEYYAAYFEPIYHKNVKYLVDLNLDLLTICLQISKLKINYQFTEKYLENTDNEQFIDFRSAIHPKKEHQIKNLTDTLKYAQVFDKGFVHNLSVIDLICCEGPQTRKKLEDSLTNQNVTSSFVY